MRIPETVLDSSGGHGSGFVIVMRNEKKVPEYGVIQTSTETKCYIAVSPNDRLSIHYSIGSGEKEYIDMIVDGVLRYSTLNTRSAATNHGAFTQVCYCKPNQDNGRKGKMQVCNMVVNKRNTNHGKAQFH